MQRRLPISTISLFLMLFLASCSGFNKITKSNDPELKYTKALEYYDKKDYYKAGILFDELLVLFKGDKRFEEVYFRYAYCKYANNEFIMAGYHFRNFYESFPRSAKAEEALYMFVYCSYLDSYPYYLDPSVTTQAMDNLQLFINVFPASKYVPDCNKYMDDLRARLSRKSLEAAHMYYHMEDYQAAIVAYNNTIKDYPELENMDEIEARLIKCQFLLASNSVDSKKAARFREIDAMVTEFESRFGTSNPYYQDVLSYRVKAAEALQQLAVVGGLDLMDQGLYREAAEAFEEQLAAGEYKVPERLHYLAVKCRYKAARTSDLKEDYQLCIKLAEEFEARFGKENKYSKKVAQYKARAVKNSKD